VQFLANIAFR